MKFRRPADAAKGEGGDARRKVHPALTRDSENIAPSLPGSASSAHGDVAGAGVMPQHMPAPEPFNDDLLMDKEQLKRFFRQAREMR